MRRTALILLWLSFVVSGVGGNRAKYEFKIAALAPERSVWGNTLKTLAREVGEQTDGQVKLKIYASGVQGDERTVLRRIRVGQLHGAVFIGSGLSIICPDRLALNLPLLFEDEVEAEFVFEEMRPDLEKRCREKGYEVLAWPQMGFSYLFSQEKVRTVDALRRSKPWLMADDPLSRNLYDALQVTPVLLPVSNVLTGLQTGLIRTVFSPPAPLIALQWHSRVKYRLDLRVAYSFGVFVIYKKNWRRLPAKLQGIMRSLFEKRNSELNRKIRRQNLDSLLVIEDEGIKTITAAEQSRREFVLAAELVGEKLVGESFSREALDRVKALVKEYRQKRQKP